MHAWPSFSTQRRLGVTLNPVLNWFKQKKSKPEITTTLFLCLALSLAACNQNTEGRQNKTDADKASQTETNVSSATQEAEDASVSAEQEPVDDSLNSPANSEQTTTDILVEELETETSIPEPRQESERSGSLVEDFGFSGADSSPTKKIQEGLFCLSDSAQAEPIADEVCERISKRLSSVKLKACNAAKLKATGCKSVNGFPIVVREFPPLADRKPKGRILIVGGTHGDELTSVSVSLRWIEKLNQFHSGLYHWHIAPLMNPDGVLKSSATRTNQNGVDLNRNMPSADWSEKAIKYWTQKGGKNPRKFPGDMAASEPETKWLIDEINTFKPDAIISIHAPYGVVDFDSLLLNTAPKSLGKLHLNLLGTYPGSLGNYAGINRNIPVITLELPHSWVMPSEKETTKIWEDLVSWLQKNITNDEVASNSE